MAEKRDQSATPKLQEANVITKKTDQARTAVHILMRDKQEPQYTFEGTWTGRDVNVVINTLRRAYLRSQQQVRAANALTQTQGEAK